VIPLAAVFQIAFRATLRSHPLRALAVLALLGSVVSPYLVAFAFSGGDALAVEGALGSAALLAPVAALFGGVALAGGDRGAEGLAPLLRGIPSAAGALASTAAGIAAAASLGTLLAAAAAAAALALGDRPFAAAPFAGAVVAACAAAPAAAAVGILLAVAAPRALAAALAALLLGGAVLAPAAAAAGGPLASLPALALPFLARDAAFGDLPAAAVALSCAASLALAAAAAAAGAVLLRAKDLAPGPRGA
jgi:hypothetical protein